MKNIKQLKYVLAAGLLITVAACKKEYLKNVNDNPNLPTNITPDVALPTSEISIAYETGGDFSRLTSILMQYVSGGDRQMLAYSKYIFSQDDFSTPWSNCYSHHMNNLYDQIQKCNAKNYKYYSGVSKILMAYSLGMVTDCWGSVPYTEAFQGSSNLQPKFDAQDMLYTQIQQLLSDGLADLNNNDGGGIVPGAEDVIYGGDIPQWKKFANALRARFYIHLCKVDASNAQKAIDAINAGAFSSNTDDAQVKFAANSNGANPWYQFNDQRGDASFTGTFLDSMIKYADPRLPLFIDTTGYKANGTTALADYYGAMDAPVLLMSYSEQKFIEAEAYNRLNNTASAQAALTAAITASMTKLGVSATAQTTYLAAHGTLSGSQSDMLRQIMTQKYFAMYLQPETWNDWRRTGIPALKANAGATLKEIPRRFLYPTVEKSTNTNTPQADLLSPRLWWDK